VPTRVDGSEYRGREGRSRRWGWEGTLLIVRHVAIVTGANHGIGAATARRLAADGVSVVVTSWQVPVDDNTGTPAQYNVNRMRKSEETVAEIRAQGGEADRIEADLLQPRSAARIFDFAEATFGSVDILVNNATGWVCGDSFVPGRLDGGGRTMAAVTAEVFDRTFGVDARAAALLMAEFSRRLLSRGGDWGRVVALTSGGHGGFPGEVTYGAAKAALENYTMSAATELGRYGVTANLVHPPVTDTGWVNDEVRALVASSPELVHVAEPDDVAEVVAWLCSDAAGLVTGSVVRLR
jgi:3-oxoacyl-[acyl-carrier protein] reductase